MIFKHFDNNYKDFTIAFKTDPGIKMQRQCLGQALLSFDVMLSKVNDFYYQTFFTSGTTFTLTLFRDTNNDMVITMGDNADLHEDQIYEKKPKLATEDEINLLKFVSLWKSMMYSDRDPEVKGFLIVDDVLE